MALNKQIYFPNPSKARIIGLSDTIRSDAYAYSTLYTVLVTETLSIKDGIFQFSLTNGADPQNIYVTLDISGKEIVLYRGYGVTGLATVNDTVTLKDLNLGGIVLATGDTIKIKFTYENGITAPTDGDIKATLFIEDYTA